MYFSANIPIHHRQTRDTMIDKRKRKWDQPAGGAPAGSIPAGGGLPPDLLAQAQAAAIAAAQKLTAVSVCCLCRIEAARYTCSATMHMICTLREANT
jgi:hypothetical protein